MTMSKKHRAAIERFVDFERADHSYQAQQTEIIRKDPDLHATIWAEKMFARLKHFGDTPTSDPLFWHFVFDTQDTAMQTYHMTVHDRFRELTGVTFKPLTELPSLQTTLGAAALYGKAAYDPAGELQLAWYAAVGADSPLPRIF